MRHIIGIHTVDNGGIHMAALRAANAGMEALQIFTAIPKFYGDKSMIRPERIERFRATLAQTTIEPEHVMAHGAYVLNVATGDDSIWTRAAAGLAREMERSSALGLGMVCFHPGSIASGGDAHSAGKRVATAMTAALRGAPRKTRLLVENSAGAGRTFGRTAAEVADILARVADDVRDRAGYGLDTCHLFASGYDIKATPEALRAVLDEFEQAVGEPPAFFHINDSAGALGSNRDRHVLIGEGEIGKEPFRWLLRDKRAVKVPLILETPEKNYDVADDDPTPDPYDVQMCELLRSLAR
ncbi:MAG: deoxyribonuclease IV [Gemmatimonadetes bacterium]|nr:deoxyribonuclease IV [Gemmatimonadota bacterium]